jgi:osmoprotectant transport system permease protein
MIRSLFLGAVLLATAGASVAETQQRALIVGSKNFTESVVLAEIVTALLKAHGIKAVHRSDMGGTQVLWQALRRGEIDIYPEYTGTLIGELLARESDVNGAADLPAALARRGIVGGPRFGFNNTYALGMQEARAAALGIERISDLGRHGDLIFGFSSEFMARDDGWPGLQRQYGLRQQARGIEHELAYRGLVQGDLDVVDFYTTDAQLRMHKLRVLSDDRGYFPEYQALLLYRQDAATRWPALTSILDDLEATISAAEMAAMNAAVQMDGEAESKVAGDFLARKLDINSDARQKRKFTVLRLTGEHLYLVAISLGMAISIALPLGVSAARRPRWGQLILAIVGLFQTIPSLALLVLMIPLLGIGAVPAIAALFLYSLLPIVRNTHSGLTNIPLALLDSADALGLPASARLRKIELPLALPSILAGIKTAAIINIGTATLGALIGAGGYGQPILTGIRLNDLSLILTGAIPAALLALFAQGLFELLERALVPRGLKL